MRWTKSLMLVLAITIALSISVYALSLNDLFPKDKVPLFSPESCEPGQTIMTISNTQNAHSGLWNAGYPIKVCYSDIFGQNYVPETGKDPHSCKDGNINRLIKLSGERNAHASKSSGIDPGFNIGVCFGDLFCKTTTEDCSGDYKLVVSLSDEKNAHVSSNNSYPLNVCCINNVTGVDFEPVLSIIKPEKSNNFMAWKKFSVNQTIGFEQISFAVVDWNVRWNFGDARSRIMSNCKTENCNTTDLYHEQAHYTISAFAKERTGLNRSSPTDHTDILVYKEGINVFAIITEPSFNQTISGGSSVRFNGRDSFVAQCFVNSGSLPNGVLNYSVGDGSNILHCYNFAKPGTSGLGSNHNFWFEWTFDANTPYESKINGTWNNNYNSIVEFNRTFVEEGQHFASLRVGYEAL